MDPPALGNHGIAKLGARFGVGPNAVRGALRRAGREKRPYGESGRLRSEDAIYQKPPLIILIKLLILQIRFN